MGAHVEQLDHTADIGLRIEADSAAEAFEAAAAATFDVLVDRERVEERETRELSLRADGWEDLLVSWLEELLYWYEGERFVLRSARVREIEPERLVAEVRGERLDVERHEPGLQIKAVTYHQLRAEETSEGFLVQVIFDI